MPSKTDYAPEEWSSLLIAPYYASMLVVIADPNFGFFKELVAMAQSIALSASESKSEFIRAIATEFNSKDTQETLKPELERIQKEKDPELLKQSLLDSLKNAVSLVRAKSEEDGNVYSQWLLYLANQTAEGSKEGGFLGVGAVRVSDKEKAALKEITQALEPGTE